MARQRTTIFTTIRTEGGLLPADLLAGVAALDRAIPGIAPGDYHLAKGESLTNTIAESWAKLRPIWKAFVEGLTALPADDAGTTLTRERWLLRLFSELGYGRLQTARADEIDGKTFPISHEWANTPIHLVSARLPLDRRTAGVKGAAGASPHSLVQDYLNRSTGHLWGFVSNGLTLRVLRDNASLTRQAYVEFDLETMFADEVFDDFVVLWLTCHQSRVEADNPTDCRLEQWTKVAAEAGTRARDDLRGGVEAAIEALGAGFVAHPANAALKERLRTGELNTHDYYRQLLRLIYRLLFLFVAEDRNLLHPPTANDEQRRRYARYYSLARIRTLAGRRRGGPHPDLWDSLVVVSTGLGKTNGVPALGLPALGSFLWSPAACPDLDNARIANQALLTALRGVAFVEDATEKVLRPVDYRNLGSEELGAIYESLLEQHPIVNADAGTFTLNTAAGNERKTTGSYYTPTSLITELLDSAVDPVVAEAASKPNPEEAILDLKVIDGACGSGHFLISAAHRIAKRLAAIRTGDDEPSPDATRTAVRDVIARCIHGIDLNPMAVELCKVSLWMESMEPGKPLGFLDHRIVRGNGLIGATPALLDAGVPEDAFKPLTGDDKTVITGMKNRSKQARAGQASLFGGANALDITSIATAVEQLDASPDTDLHAVQAKAARWNELVESADYQAAVHAADTWCAAFVAPKTKSDLAITHEEFATARDNPDHVAPAVRAVVERLAHQYAFLHWHLAFPEVHMHGGFDVVVGNPPWEQLQYDPREVFAASHPEISDAPTMAKRDALVAALELTDPEAYREHLRALRYMEAQQHFVHASGLFPLTSVGRLNTAPLFVERSLTALSSSGRVGIIVPTGIATDSFNQEFFRSCVDEGKLVSLLSFENEEHVFPGVHNAIKFCLLTLRGCSDRDQPTEYAFFARQVNDLRVPGRKYHLLPEDLALLNPNSGTAPVFRSSRDAEITKAVYRRLPVIERTGGEPSEAHWQLGFQLMFMMNEASRDFVSEASLSARKGVRMGNRWVTDEETFVPLYEAKLVHQFNHRASDFALNVKGDRSGRLPDVPEQSLADPSFTVTPRHWMPMSLVSERLKISSSEWLLGFRDVATATGERTMIASALPISAVGHNMPLLYVPDAGQAAVLLALLNSFAFDYIVRQKIGGNHITLFTLKQLPLPRMDDLHVFRPELGGSFEAWLRVRILELVYASWDITGFASSLGVDSPPFRWNARRRQALRAEVDAGCFLLFGYDRAEVDYVLDTFALLRKVEEKESGEYQTKRLVLECYDSMSAAAAVGAEYQTILDPPPADPRCAHPESTRPDWA